MANGIEAYRQWQTPRCATRLAQLLLAAGADPDAYCQSYGPGEDTVLGLLVTSEGPSWAGVQAELVEVLCRAGAKPDGIPGDGGPLWGGSALAIARRPRLWRGARIDNLLFAAAVGDRERTRSFADEPTHAWGGAAAAARELDAARMLELALIAAAAAGHRDIVVELLTHEPDLTYREPVWNNTALDAARWHQRADVVALLEPLHRSTQIEDS